MPSSSSSLRVQTIASLLVTKILRSSSERSMIGGMKPSSSERRPCTGSPCIGSAATILTVSPSASFSRRPLPISVPPVPRPATNARDLVELLEDLDRRAVVVGERVGLVAVLVGHVVARSRPRPSRARARPPRWSPWCRRSRRSPRRTCAAAGCAPASRCRASRPSAGSPCSEQIIASEMPVLPEVGSRIVWPGAIAPFSSASSIIARATRSLTDPVGLRDSSFAQIRTPGFGREPLQLDQRRVADRLDDVAVAASAGPVLEFAAGSSASIEDSEARAALSARRRPSPAGSRARRPRRPPSRAHRARARPRR